MQATRGLSTGPQAGDPAKVQNPLALLFTKVAPLYKKEHLFDGILHGNIWNMVSGIDEKYETLSIY